MSLNGDGAVEMDPEQPLTTTVEDLPPALDRPDPTDRAEDEEDLATDTGVDTGDAYDKQGEAPWAPVPTAIARRWLKENPTASLGVVLPTVYEEDRSKKLQDLGFSQGMDFISHRRAAEQSAQELGQDDYDYDTEMAEIAKERQQAFLQPSLGQADAMAQRMIGLAPPTGSPRTPAPGARPDSAGGSVTQPGMAADSPGGHRTPLSGDSKAQFRADQRSAGT